MEKEELYAHINIRLNEQDIKNLIAEEYECDPKEVIPSYSLSDGFEIFINKKIKRDYEEQKRETE